MEDKKVLCSGRNTYSLRKGEKKSKEGRHEERIENLGERRRIVTRLRLHVIKINSVKNGVRRDVRGAEEAILQAELWRSFTWVIACDQLTVFCD